jgi:uncharacterized protein (DUF488 family)
LTKDICTIGFSKKSLRTFIDLLRKGNVTRVVDIRLNNTSQLAGFAKKDDLKYVLELVGVDYIHDTDLAPTQDILKAYKKKEIAWSDYEKLYLDLIIKRKIERKIVDIFGEQTPCFLCSEDKPHHCHRRLLAEYLKEFDKNIYIKHLV